MCAKSKKLNLEAIVKNFGISSEHVAKMQPKINDGVLKDIYDDYLKSQKELVDEQEEIMRKLKDVATIAHSLRMRIKDADHLIEKIIRNFSDSKSEKYQNVNEENYKAVITDLIGFRIIILGKEDWLEVHNFLCKTFVNDSKNYITGKDDYYLKDNEACTGCCMVEQPTVYTKIGDDEENFENYRENGLKVEATKKAYRSIHYLIRFQKFYCELQVRTIFEEGWLEFDHKIKYPYDKRNPIKNDFLEMMSKMAQTSDYMISFYSKYPKFFEEIKRKEKSGDTDSIKQEKSEETSIEQLQSANPQNFKERLSDYIFNL